MGIDYSLSEKRMVEIFEGYLTHNLIPMAEDVGLYHPLWRAEEFFTVYPVPAHALIDHIERGLSKLEEDPGKYKALEPENGFGTYDGFVLSLRALLAQCRENPEALYKCFV